MSSSTGTSVDIFRDDIDTEDSSPEGTTVVHIDSNLIHWRPHDPENPFNFPLWRKVMICLLLCIQTAWITCCSSSSSAISQEMQEEFNVSSLVSRLPVAIFVFGMGVGPVLLTPLAEDFGRKKVNVACLCLIPCALAHNLGTIVVCRFFCGILGATVFNSVANIPDLWKGDDIVGLWAMNIWAYSAEVLVLGPMIAAYINHAFGWRWVYGIWGIVGAVLIIPYVILVPETRRSAILVARAQHARRAGHIDAWAIDENLRRRSFRQILTETLFRPAVMLFTEPIVYCFALYDGLNYGIIYLAVEATPLIYAQYGFRDPQVQLTYLAMVIGFTLAIPLFYLQHKVTLWQEKKQGRKNVPENKLLWVFVAAFLFPISMYWFAWTGRPPISIYWSLGALVLFGLSSHIVFLAVCDYTVESYGLMASSAVTGQSFARECFCGILALFGVQFYHDVGFEWASTILAILATLMGVFPFLFYRYGPTIRQRSRYAQEIARLEDEERQPLLN
ncbi:Polyamine transporter 1 [Termitomyces sp. T112]|nr:Polyamine transporter 1 [Termitomyces sp. T112]